MGILSALFGSSAESGTDGKAKEQEKKSRKKADPKARNPKARNSGKRDWVDEMIFMDEILDD